MWPLWVSLTCAAMPWSSMPAAQREQAMAKIQKLPTLRERVVASSQLFLGTTYVNSPLGEGTGRDADPLFRWDAFDCVTLVETSVALSLASPNALEAQLTSLRYQGAPSWDNRLHLTESQWLPQWQRRGLLRPVSFELAGKFARRVEKVLTAQTWETPSAVALGLQASHQPVGAYALDIVPASHAQEALLHAPEGLLVVVVRADKPNSVTRVTHMGILVHTARGPALRHASRSYRKVVDEPLGHYLERNLRYGGWTIEGLALFEPVLPGSDENLRLTAPARAKP